MPVTTLAGAVRAARAGRHRLPQDRRRGRRARGAARRRLAALPARRSSSLEALAPVTMAPAWEAWEPLLTGNGYRFAFFDSLNRYYVAEEHAALARPARGRAAPRSTASRQFRQFKPALDDACAPGPRPRPAARRRRHGAAAADVALTRSPSDSSAALIRPIWTGRLQPSDIAAAHQRLFGTPRRRLGEYSATRRRRHDPRSLPQCGRDRSVPGRLRAHLGKLGLVTDPVASGV